MKDLLEKMSLINGDPLYVIGMAQNDMGFSDRSTANEHGIVPQVLRPAPVQGLSYQKKKGGKVIIRWHTAPYKKNFLNPVYEIDWDKGQMKGFHKHLSTTRSYLTINLPYDGEYQFTVRVLTRCG